MNGEYMDQETLNIEQTLDEGATSGSHIIIIERFPRPWLSLEKVSLKSSACEQ
jgi:hypothetical protein